MTGEMHKSEVTRENYPIYFAAADQVEGATVEPFDQYQGPYIHVPDVGRIFMRGPEDHACAWYDEEGYALSDPFLEGDMPEAIDCFVKLIEWGGTKIKLDLQGEPEPLPNPRALLGRTEAADLILEVLGHLTDFGKIELGTEQSRKLIRAHALLKLEAK